MTRFDRNPIQTAINRMIIIETHLIYHGSNHAPGYLYLLKLRKYISMGACMCFEKKKK